jgi:5'-3' exonuclease
MKKILLIDGNNLGWRSFGRAPLVHEGKRVEAIYVGLNMLRKYLMDFKPDQCIVAWDGGRDKRRTKMFPQYKRKKKTLSEIEKRERKELFEQIKILRLFFELLGMTQYLCIGREADDLMFNIIKTQKFMEDHFQNQEKAQFIVVSTDEDMFQLFITKDNTKVYSPIKKKTIDKKEVEKMFKIPYIYFASYKALVGDKSDNIPGVKGFGEKKAQRFIQIVDNNNYKQLPKSEYRLIEEYNSKRKQWVKMIDLVRFLDIDKKEMEEGKTEVITKSVSKFDTQVMALLKTCGFERHIKQYDRFIKPFQTLLQKQNG